MLLCYLLIGILLVDESYEQVLDGASLTKAQKEGLLSIHNGIRGSVSAGNMQRLIWNCGLEKVAITKAQSCDAAPTANRVNLGGFDTVGENIATLNGTTFPTSVVNLAQQWFVPITSSAPSYTFGTFGGTATCAISQAACDAWTQAIWATSCSIGCGASLCENLNGSPGVLLVCYYGEGGNVAGQEPYEQSATKCSSCSSTCQLRTLCPSTCPADSPSGCPVITTTPIPATVTVPVTVTAIGGPGGVDTTTVTTTTTTLPTTTVTFPMGPVPEFETMGCYDYHRLCKQWAAADQCQINKSMMRILCSFTCGYCGPFDKIVLGRGNYLIAKPGGIPLNPICYDHHEECAFWANNGYCLRSRAWMFKFCSGTCSGCNPTQVLEVLMCVDRNDYCARWALYNECNKNPDYMHLNCRKSCKLC